MGQSDIQEAILFLSNGLRVVKQMTYMEFEAVLDGVVGLEDFADQDIRAVYLEINGFLEIESCVAFKVSFDESGNTDFMWNIPLRRLAYQNPQLVSFRERTVKTSCSVGCSIKSHADQLWDFREFGGVQLVLDHLSQAVESNTLGLLGEKRDNGSTQSFANDARHEASMEEPPSLGDQACAYDLSDDEFMQHQAGNPDLSPQMLGAFDELLKKQLGAFLGQQMPQPTPQHPQAQYPTHGNGSASQPIVASQALNQQQLNQHQMQQQMQQQIQQQMLYLQSLQAQNAPAQQMSPPEGQPVIGTFNEAAAPPVIEQVDVEAMKQALEQQYSQELTEYKLQSERLIGELQVQMERLKGKIKSLLVSKESYENRIDEQTHEIKSLRNMIDKKMPKLQKKYKMDLAMIEDRYKQELDELKNELGGERDQIQKQLTEKLESAQETGRKLREELTGLRRDKLRLLSSGSDKFFEKMRESGLKMVAFHPGVGHITIPLDDLGDYVESSTAYVAKQCGIEAADYEAWLKHTENPVCSFPMSDHEHCQAAIIKVLDPKNYVAGVSDRCFKHRSTMALSQLNKDGIPLTVGKVNSANEAANMLNSKLN